jgi:hypothetical protein
MNPLQQRQMERVGCPGKRQALLYNIFQQLYTGNHSVNVMGQCNGFTVKNAGLSTVLVNGIPVLPKESLSVGGNEGEVYVGRIDISFVAPATPSVTNNAAWVIQKFFEDQTF